MLDPDPKSMNPDPETLPVVPLSGRSNLARRPLEVFCPNIYWPSRFFVNGLRRKTKKE